MKIHNYRPHLAILAAACSLAACGQSTPPATETTAAGAVTDTPAPSGAKDMITPGLYHVCRVEPSAQVHGSLAGDHVPDGTPVFIKPIDPDTKTTLLCIGETCPEDPTLASVQDVVFWMTGDETRLQTVKEFGHKQKNPSTNAMEAVPPVRHLVQLSKEKEEDIPKDQCTKENVLMLRFCAWGEGQNGPTWLCQGEQPHAGAVHLEP